MKKRRVSTALWHKMTPKYHKKVGPAGFEPATKRMRAQTQFGYMLSLNDNNDL
jgi:hypothetical protein